MNDLKAKALEISKRFPFKEFKYTASALSQNEGNKAVPESTDNHLDKVFMKWLEEGKHLEMGNEQ